MSDVHRPRKRFGQHFLVDLRVIEKIIDALAPTPQDQLVEIGAGQGALTDGVLSRSGHLQVIEIDRDLVALLHTKYPNGNLIIHEGDVLKSDFESIWQRHQQPLRVFGNLPYNISTPILFHLLHYSHRIQDMLFMLQKEIIDRMAAPPNHPTYGRLSVMIQYACQVQALFDIPPSAFSPPPKVMSSIVWLKPYAEQKPHPIALDYDHFAQLVNMAFSHRRKTLRNALNKQINDAIFAEANIDPKRRPETLSVTEFVNLSNLAVQNN